MSWRLVLVGAILLSVVVSGVSNGTAAPTGTIVVTSVGSAWEAFIRRAVLPGFEAENPGTHVDLAIGLSRDWVAKLRVAGKNDPPYDVVIANAIWLSSLRKEGWFENLAVDKVPNLLNVWPEFRNKSDNGVLFAINPLGIAYRRDLLKAPPPKRWKDLWNPDYKGKIALFSVANSGGLMFIMMMAKVWSGNEKNIDVAFQKIRELKPFRQTDFDIARMLAAGEVQIGVIDSPQASRLKQQGVPLEFVVPLEGMFMFEQDTNVTVGSKNKAAAYAFVNYMLSAPVQEKWAREWFVTPANRSVKIDGELAQLIPVHTLPQIHSLIKWDWGWVDSGARDVMIDRWNREIVEH